jgi:hypothetical protein
MKKFLQLLSLITIFTTKVFAGPNDFPINWKLELRFDNTTKVYSVWGKPDTTKLNWPMATAQITILVPDSVDWLDIAPTSVNFGTWGQGDTNANGLYSGGYNYHAIATVGGNKNIYKDSAIEFFNFKYDDRCINFLRLIRNNPETYNFAVGGPKTIPADDMDPLSGIGSYDFYNSIGNGLSLVFPEVYELNVNNYGDNCGPKFLAPLDVQILDFKGVANKDFTNTIFWQLADETNAKEYVIERKTINGEFQPVYSTFPIKNNLGYYEFLDTKIDTVNLYRLKLIDVNGQSSYSKIVTLTHLRGVSDAFIYPSPATDNVNFVFESRVNQSDLKIQILDVTGKVVASQTEKVNIGTYTFGMDISTLSLGNYMLRYVNDGDLTNGVIKFTKMKK